MTKGKVCAILSSVLLVCLLFLAMTSALLFFGKTGVILSIPRRYITNVHVIFGGVMLLSGFVHWLLNLPLHLSELKMLFKKGK